MDDNDRFSLEVTDAPRELATRLFHAVSRRPGWCFASVRHLTPAAAFRVVVSAPRADAEECILVITEEGRRWAERKAGRGVDPARN